MTLDLDSVRQYADPAIRRERKAVRRPDAARFGTAIRQLRVERGLRQSEGGGRHPPWSRTQRRGSTGRPMGRLRLGRPGLERVGRLTGCRGSCTARRELVASKARPARLGHVET